MEKQLRAEGEAGRGARSQKLRITTQPEGSHLTNGATQAAIEERCYLNPFGSVWEARHCGSVPHVTHQLVCLPHRMEARLPTVYTPAGTHP